MAIACSYNCTDLDNHDKVQCGAFPKGGISTIAILECDHVITDFSSATQWQDAIDDRDAVLIEPIRGIVPEFSEVVGVNPTACGSQDILDGFDATMTWMDFNVNSSNDNFYNELNQRQSFIVWYECDTDKIRVVELVTSFISKLNTPESNKEKQFYQVVSQWSTGTDDGIPPLFNAPTGIFSQ